MIKDELTDLLAQAIFYLTKGYSEKFDKTMERIMEVYDDYRRL